jgi:hypothetical protein
VLSPIIQLAGSPQETLFEAIAPSEIDTAAAEKATFMIIAKKQTRMGKGLIRISMATILLINPQVQRKIHMDSRK